MNTENVALPSAEQNKQMMPRERKQMVREARQEVLRELGNNPRFRHASVRKLQFLAKTKVDGMMKELRSY